jgi:prepilin-type N-terminal cleavage/methylation domain-containing protein
MSSQSANSPKSLSTARSQAAFSLVEILVTVSIITIIAGVAYSSIRGSVQQSAMVVARQQQVELQQALDAWLVAQSSGVKSLEDARAGYIAASTDAAKFALVEGYLKNAFFSSTGSGVTSSALNSVGQELRFSDWTERGYPSVEMHSK